MGEYSETALGAVGPYVQQEHQQQQPHPSLVYRRRRFFLAPVGYDPMLVQAHMRAHGVLDTPQCINTETDSAVGNADVSFGDVQRCWTPQPFSHTSSAGSAAHTLRPRSAQDPTELASSQLYGLPRSLAKP